VIDRRFPLSEVAAAVRYVEDGHARGKSPLRFESVIVNRVNERAK
jgi:Zinc-binding dehydrogenase